MGRDTLPVIIVGGGIAGATFALELAGKGRRVVLLERTLSAHHKVCGEFLSQGAQDLLASLGLDARSLGATSIDHFRLVTGKWHTTTRLPFAAAGLSRLRLDEVLLATAERAGATVIRGVAVTRIEPRDGEVVVRADKRTWRGAVAGLATGKHVLRGLSRTSGSMVGFKLHLEATEAARRLAGTVQLVFFRNGYAGACLIEGGVLSTAWVMRQSLVQKLGGSWEAHKAHLARQSDMIGDLLAGAKPLFAKPLAVSAIPYGYLRVEPIAPNVFPVGDQIAVVPSFTGDGIAIGLYSAAAAAGALLAGESAATYQRHLTAMLKPTFRLARAMGLVLENPITCTLSVAAGKLFPSLALRCAEATRLKCGAPNPFADVKSKIYHNKVG